jgi:hypothetical protein
MPTATKKPAAKTASPAPDDLLAAIRRAENERLVAAHAIIAQLEEEHEDLTPSALKFTARDLSVIDKAGILAHGRFPVCDRDSLAAVLRQRRRIKNLIAQVAAVGDNAKLQQLRDEISETSEALDALAKAPENAEVARRAAKLASRVAELRNAAAQLESSEQSRTAAKEQLRNAAPEALRANARRRLQSLGDLRRETKELANEIRMIESGYLDSFAGTRGTVNGWPSEFVKARCPEAYQPPGNGNPARPHPEHFPRFLRELRESLPGLKKRHGELSAELAEQTQAAYELVDRWAASGGALTLEMLSAAELD